MSMKLVFPGGEHPQVLLGPGVSRVGSGPQATIILREPGVLPEHCQLHVHDTGVVLDVPHGTTVCVNGKPVDGLISLRAGDSVSFDHVLARLATMDSLAPSAEPGATGHPAANDDPGMTVVRPVMPMYVLRGVTGGAFGRSYPLDKPLTVGRSSECDVHVSDAGLSRLHARLVPCDDGILVEDLESTNGTFVNDHRIKRERIGIGDEISFDKVRFRLVGSGANAHAEARPVAPVAPARTERRHPWAWVMVVGVMTLATLSALAVTSL